MSKKVGFVIKKKNEPIHLGNGVYKYKSKMMIVHCDEYHAHTKKCLVPIIKTKQ